MGEGGGCDAHAPAGTSKSKYLFVELLSSPTQMKMKGARSGRSNEKNEEVSRLFRVERGREVAGDN